MSAEKGNRFPLQPEQFEFFEDKNQKISPVWFFGSGKKDQGITSVEFSPEFFTKIGEEAKSYVDDYFKQLNMFDVQDEESKKKAEKAERRIKEVTGFSMEDLANRRLDLESKCKGQSWAPFKYVLY